MKITTVALVALIPITAIAQDNPSPYPMGMNGADMQNMMQQMQKAQACMEKIDQDKLKALESKAKQSRQEIKSLCEKGERNEAQQKAMAYGKNIMGDPTVQELRKCGKMMQGAMKKMMPDMSLLGRDKDYTDKNVCDAL